LQPYITTLTTNKIKNLIFDLGGVILDLDFTRTHEAFSHLSGIPVSELKEKILHQPFFLDYEKGLLTDEEFRNQLRVFSNKKITDHELDFAWNAMLVNIKKERLDLLLRLKSKHQTFLLSNTNGIHVERINEIVFNVSGEKTLEPFFHRVYFSHEMKMRKPHAEIFETVLKENNLNASECLFMDDLAENIQGAKSVGIETIQITSPDHILELFA